MNKSTHAAAESLTQAHDELLDDLRKLQESAASGANAELRDRLVAAQTDIAEHFAFEEQNGYLDAVREREPWTDRTIQQLAEEHGELKRTLDALVRKAQGTPSLSEAFREEVRAWVRHVRQHETRENALIQDAFNSDIAAED